MRNKFPYIIVIAANFAFLRVNIIEDKENTSVSRIVNLKWERVLKDNYKLNMQIMPRVGKKKFAYTPKGKAAAKQYAKGRGSKVVMKKTVKGTR